MIKGAKIHPLSDCSSTPKLLYSQPLAPPSSLPMRWRTTAVWSLVLIFYRKSIRGSSLIDVVATLSIRVDLVGPPIDLTIFSPSLFPLLSTILPLILSHRSFCPTDPTAQNRYKASVRDILWGRGGYRSLLFRGGCESQQHVGVANEASQLGLQTAVVLHLIGREDGGASGCEYNNFGVEEQSKRECIFAPLIVLLR